MRKPSMADFGRGLGQASFSSKNALTGMNNSLQQIFTGGKRAGAKRRGKTWDLDSHTGDLWIWTGTFKRWKRHLFSAAQPGLLSYSNQRKRSRKITGESINLHEATITVSREDSRYFKIQTPTGRVFHLRTTDSRDLEPCLASIKASADQYKTMLNKASLLASNLASTGPSQVNLAGNCVSSSTQELKGLGGSVPLGVKLNQGEPMVLREVHERVASRMEDLEPLHAAVETQIQSIQESLDTLSKALNLHPIQATPLSHNNLAHPRVEDLQKHDSMSRSQDRLLEGGLSLTRADSFQSAMSDLQKSPTSLLETTHDCQRASPQGTLAEAWRDLTYAIEDGFRSEATKLVELQTENEALKAAMRHFKVQAQRKAAKLDSINPSSPAQRASSESDDEIARSGSMDGQFFEDLNVRFKSRSLNLECREAIEALEAVQRHAFAVRSAQQSGHLDNEPDPPAVDFEDAGSEEEVPSEPGSRQPSITYELSPAVVNVWEVAAQRDRLPNPAPLNRGFSIWSVLKSAIGKDLTRITLPATINEPLSALQRIQEDLEYRSILDEALATQDPGMRTLLIAAFIASGYSASLQRESKPFNPLLGETFEWQSADQSCKFFCEQVSHHPPVSCWWSESSTGWQYYGEMELRSKFWGKSVEMLPTGTCWLKLGDELWSWNKANMSINNIIIGTIWLEWYGKITLQNHTTGKSTVMNFPKVGRGSLDQRGIVTCSAISQSGATLQLQGKFTDKLIITDASSNILQEVFRINPPVEQGALQYNMTRNAMTLNTPERTLFAQLPPTDSRFRPDQRALEDAELDKATEEKLRLEEKQREVRKERKEKGEAFFPSWFRLREMTSQQKQGADYWLGSPLVRLPTEAPPCLWEFTGEYWTCKAKNAWDRCPDIYSGGIDALPSPYESKEGF